jgi:hypothetical protein
LTDGIWIIENVTNADKKEALGFALIRGMEKNIFVLYVLSQGKI